jgi:hypothetical protein
MFYSSLANETNKERAMKLFLERYRKQITGVLSGWDRLAFRGTLRWLASVRGLSSYLSRKDMLLKDFSDWAQHLTAQVRQSCDERADNLGIRTIYLRSSGVDKDALARRIAEQDNIKEGPICMLSVVEPAYSPTVVGNKKSRRLEVVMRPRRCVWVYAYFNDPDVGFGHLRLETWLPFTVKGCLNGRHWLERSLMREGIEYIKQDNCFRWLADPVRAQALAEEQLRTHWPGLLDTLATTCFPVMSGLLPQQPVDYYWSADETEWATDIMFRSTKELDRLFPMLARHGLIVSDSASVMRYLGHIDAGAALPVKLAGDVRGDRRRRYEGICVKHRKGSNSVKLYNKAGNTLRGETTINDPRAFKVFRQPDDDTGRTPRWLPMRKGVADLERRSRLSQASNDRYFNMLAACPTDAKFIEVVGTVCQPVQQGNRRIRALNPSAAQDLQLLRFLTQGQWAIEGLRNRDLVGWLEPNAEKLDAAGRRKLTARASRLLAILRAHGLIQRVQKTHRYQVTPKGYSIAALIVSTATIEAKELMEKAA